MRIAKLLPNRFRSGNRYEHAWRVISVFRQGHANIIEIMNCPKCASPMTRVLFHTIEVDRCTNCQGIWFDEFEKDELKRLRGSEAVDTGNAKLGKKFNQVERINCPRCDSRMIRMVDVNQPHIWFEHCTVCSGSFFDAGEFRDLKDHTIGDFFKDLLVKERK